MAGRFLEHLIDPTATYGELSKSEAVVETLAAVAQEISAEAGRPEVARHLIAAAESVESATDAAEVAEGMWSVFCPSAVGLLDGWPTAVAAIRSRRALHDVEPNPEPIDPSSVLLTANVLLTRPLGTGEGLPPDEAVAAHRATSQAQAAWYDHPIPIDSPPERHEAAYGLGALDDAVAFERRRGILDGPVPVVLSVSTTHPGLDAIAFSHLRRVLLDVALPNLDLYVFTEAAAERLVTDGLGPALDRLGRSSVAAKRVFGVAGPYGRHYSFLKAISAVWNVLVDNRIRGTFKIDLDQAFPQQQLVAETGGSAFEHIAHPAWGGSATDSAGRPVALDFLAGALVNAGDAGSGLFLPDVVNPGPARRAEHLIFHGALPQAVSTEAEMMPGPDDELRQRVHVTGGTTGTTVAGLRRSRPFSPSFWGRAEDQAFGLSVWLQRVRPVSLHAAGLVMRHDKDAVAGAAVAAAAIDKLIGDHERILMFSALGRALDPGLESVKADLAPFTGAFISPMPVTLTFVRLAVTALSWAKDGRVDSAHRLFAEGVLRCDRIRRFVADELIEQLEEDRLGWRDVHDALDALETALSSGEKWALVARKAARGIVEDTRFETQ